MLVRVVSLRFGYKAYPVSLWWQDRFAAHMKDMVGRKDSSAFFQEDYDLPEEVTRNRQFSDLQRGWGITVRVDPWIYGHWLGYDAHTVAE